MQNNDRQKQNKAITTKSEVVVLFPKKRNTQSTVIGSFPFSDRNKCPLVASEFVSLLLLTDEKNVHGVILKK